jgi:hypothetical protein
MKYGQIAGSSRINTFIYSCFEHICDQDERKFVKKFRELPQDSNEIMHTFRELIAGAYLCTRGLIARYEHAVASRTPDWSILDDASRSGAILELTNFHVDKTTETEIEEQLHARGIALAWRDAHTNNRDRLYYSIWHKMQVYQALVQELEIPYIVAVFGEFSAAIDEEEVHACLLGSESGLFEMYPEVSGVLFFEEKRGCYPFSYTPNPSAQLWFDLPSGVFPSGVA